MEELLEHLQVEFKYERILSILESATRVARSGKAIAYEEAKKLPGGATGDQIIASRVRRLMPRSDG